MLIIICNLVVWFTEATSDMMMLVERLEEGE